MPTIVPLDSRSLPHILDLTTQIIRACGVVAIPTESFYALAASALDPAAVRRVYELKRRPEGKPILVLIADRAQLHALVDHIPPAAEVLMNTYWPGPLTLIFPASPRLPTDLTAGTGSVGIRQLGRSELTPILQHIGPVTGTSANHSGSPPAQTAQEVQSAFNGEIDLILDGGPTPGGTPSTIVDTSDPVHLVREGPISRDQIQATLATVGIAFKP